MDSLPRLLVLVLSIGANRHWEALCLPATFYLVELEASNYTAIDLALLFGGIPTDVFCKVAWSWGYWTIEVRLKEMSNSTCISRYTSTSFLSGVAVRLFLASPGLCNLSVIP